jgi:hypothetical protein
MNEDTLPATWASRYMRRIGYEGKTDGQPWRILPNSEMSPTKLDTAFTQLVMEHAAAKLGMTPDGLTGDVGMAEQKHWEARGWCPPPQGQDGDLKP